MIPFIVGRWTRTHFSPEAKERRERVVAETIEAEKQARASLRAQAIARMQGREGYGGVKEAVGEIDWKKGAS